jgi:hypothetical protein
MRHDSSFLVFLLAAAVACSPGSSSDEGGPGDTSDIADGETTLDVPLIDSDGQLLSVLNDRLAAKKMRVFPASLAMASDDASRDAFSDWNAYADEVNEALGTEVTMVAFGTPDQYPGLCYRGKGEEVAELVGGLTDNVFSDMLQLIGVRFHDQTELFFEDEEIDEDRLPPEWTRFTGQGDDVMLLYVSNDSGDNLDASAIPRCGSTPPAGTTLDVPIIDSDGTSLTALNAKLEAKGMRAFPASIVMASDDASRDAFSDWNAYADEVNEALGTEVTMVAFGTPDQYPDLCYRGEGEEVAELAGGLTDNVFSDMFQVIGYRFHDETEFVLDVDEEDQDSFPPEWVNFPGTSDDVMLLYVSNDSGDDITASAVPRCE